LRKGKSCKFCIQEGFLYISLKLFMEKMLPEDLEAKIEEFSEIGGVF